MAYQEQFTTGEAHRIVTGYSFLPSDVGCKAAIKQLSRRYGNAEVIANSYVQQVLQWPSIKAEDPKSIYAFSIILKECQAATRCIRTMNILEHTENLRQILKKLPVYRHDRWRRTVQELHKNGKVVKFSNLVDFVELEAMKLNDPVWGRNALSCLQKREQKYSKVMTAATDASEGLQCWGCDGPHRIKECPKLKESNLTERRSLVRAKRKSSGFINHDMKINDRNSSQFVLIHCISVFKDRYHHKSSHSPLETECVPSCQMHEAFYNNHQVLLASEKHKGMARATAISQSCSACRYSTVNRLSSLSRIVEKLQSVQNAQDAKAFLVVVQFLAVISKILL
eukprot:gene12403-3062_t